MDRSSKPTFSFVNLKHPGDLKSEETRLRIRRLAMTEVGKARRKPKTKRDRNKIILEFRNPIQRQSKIDRLGSASLDPFGRYPIKLDNEGRTLLANSTPGTSHASQLRGSWFQVGLESPAAFHNVLANSQNFIFQKMDGNFPSVDNALALVHHQKALRLARELLSDSTNHTSNEAVGTMVSFTCHHALLGSFAGGEWKQHQNALLKIIRLRGGFETIDQEHLRITVSWGDLIDSFAQDIPPSVPLPRKWKADRRPPYGSIRPHSALSLAWKQQLPRRLDWVSIFDGIVHLISLDCTFNEQQMELATISGSWVEPIMYRHTTIAIRHGPREYTRRGQSPVWTAALTRNLQFVLLKYKMEWNELKPLLVWTIYFASIETSELAERSQFVFMLAMLMKGLQLREWNEFLQVVKDVLWVDKVFARSDKLVRVEVMQMVSQSSVLMESPVIEVIEAI
ncbi:hypothetical protein EJ07DRAFT_152225 [Lizonia empirigonia]|nr:hypothetical protein EJ07DRAFT_152225 [Lizonia empirigonia]